MYPIEKATWSPQYALLLLVLSATASAQEVDVSVQVLYPNGQFIEKGSTGELIVEWTNLGPDVAPAMIAGMAVPLRVTNRTITVFEQEGDASCAVTYDEFYGADSPGILVINITARERGIDVGETVRCSLDAVVGENAPNVVRESLSAGSTGLDPDETNNTTFVVIFTEPPQSVPTIGILFAVLLSALVLLMGSNQIDWTKTHVP